MKKMKILKKATLLQRTTSRKEQTKPKVSRRKETTKIRIEMKDMETKKSTK